VAVVVPHHIGAQDPMPHQQAAAVEAQVTEEVPVIQI
jgi:hypothetical protein